MSNRRVAWWTWWWICLTVQDTLDDGANDDGKDDQNADSRKDKLNGVVHIVVALNRRERSVRMLVLDTLDESLVLEIRLLLLLVSAYYE